MHEIETNFFEPKTLKFYLILYMYGPKLRNYCLFISRCLRDGYKQNKLNPMKNGGLHLVLCLSFVLDSGIHTCGLLSLTLLHHSISPMEYEASFNSSNVTSFGSIETNAWCVSFTYVCVWVMVLSHHLMVTFSMADLIFLTVGQLFWSHDQEVKSYPAVKNVISVTGKHNIFHRKCSICPKKI